MREPETSAGVPAAGGWPGRWTAAVRDAIVSVLFPAPCRICEQLLERGNRVPICTSCLASIRAIPEPICGVCGVPLERFDARNSPAESVCPACRPRPGRENEGRYAFAAARSYASYSGEAVQAILLLKFERIAPLASHFARELARIYERDQKVLEADVVVPVPLHRRRQRERGYNQADLLAKPLAKLLGLPRKPILLVRTKPRPDKQVLSFEERWQSVRGAFATRPGSQVDNKRVLLVDDVMTTGATLDACARVLLKAGAKSVVGLTVGRAIQKPLAVDE